MKQRISLWIFFLIFLPSSEAYNNAECAVANKRVVCDEGKEGHHYPFCEQKMSRRYCNQMVVDDPEICRNTLDKVLLKDVCYMKRNKDERCGTIKPRHITSPEESLVEMHLYYQNKSKWWGEEALVNLTLPTAKWKALEFQYSFIGTTYKDTCRSFTLSEEVTSTLMYECRVLNPYENSTSRTRLTVQSDSGHGATYLFTIPQPWRINPERTCPGDWHTFFYIHQDALQLYKHLPVTIQSSPYGQVDYKIVLVQYLDAHGGRNQTFHEVDEKRVTINKSNSLQLVYLSPVTNPGNYTVRVQIVSDWCPKDEGCYVSVSPIFIMPPSHTWIVLLATTITFTSIFGFLLLILRQKLRMYRDFFKHLKSPTVLLVYHPESKTAMNFVTTLAEFLKTTCCFKNLIAENYERNKNPNNWIKTQMNKADRILFIIPMDCEAESCTPLRNQWKAALGHCTEYENMTSPDHYKRMAKLMLPGSGEVPCEIKNIRQFDLTNHPAALANWMHGGVFLDQFFFWRPRIHAYKNLKPTWADVRSVAKRITSASTKRNDKFPVVPLEAVVRMSNRSMKREDLSNSDSEDEESSIALIMDPDIPSFEMLCESITGSNESLDDSVIDNGIFT